MSKVITFSRVYPSYHPKAGEPTNFIRKLLKSRLEEGHLTESQIVTIGKSLGLMGMLDLAGVRNSLVNDKTLLAKHHTIRVGNRFSVGEKFSPRAWSGTPYHSKQLHLGPDIEITNVFDVKFELDVDYFCISINGVIFAQSNKTYDTNKGLDYLANNDGLNYHDLLKWFNKPFTGQIICWKPNLYS